MDTAAQEIAVNENGAMLYNGAVCTAAMPDGQDFVPGMAIRRKVSLLGVSRIGCLNSCWRKEESQKGWYQIIIQE